MLLLEVAWAMGCTFGSGYGTTVIMKKSITVAPKKKRRGRPAKGGRDPHIAARMPPPLIAQVEAWATANDTSRSDAFRRLVELGLKAKK
jgi:hypothetical protein